jgi:flagellar hook-basal body complex protein FliE
MLNTEQASLGFSMALQVRNKLIDAYQEVMRMSV